MGGNIGHALPFQIDFRGRGPQPGQIIRASSGRHSAPSGDGLRPGWFGNLGFALPIACHQFNGG